ncbi:nucleotide sugar dehydrogenase [Senegalia massiliensis]|uniref:Nucleotide sugar dehydrogenase n=1 Tax=Senegalia massiliensis TaxID=1720316 RepID=A0A845R136_9CLOT|nr:nucleotide sugar dehydrogenase [Senegalia massiliensis]NBI08140.1 nucleotide sugar dehydrogenase [Senegalia massiliensis]
MKLYEKIKNKEEKISVIGLGYVGLPLAIAFAKRTDVIGIDHNKNKIKKYHDGIDVTGEVGDKSIKETSAVLTNDESKIREAKFHIVAVPTPINGDKTPNLDPVVSATTTVGRNLTKGSIVVFESTVYPGVTEEVCVPILEKESGLKYGEDFKVGYSPERINPGDKVNTLEKIVKIVSGMDDETLEDVAKVYELIIEAGVHRAESIKVAEAAKVIENSQRDINIAFMNELSQIFNMMNIDTKAVLEAAGTKWNFLNFTPGLVGGHCIGVDPYYFVYKAEQLGYHSQIILSGRKINDNMGKYVAENTVKTLIKADKKIKDAKVVVLGITFKENCPDVRNTRVIDIINELKEYGIDITVVDPLADKEEVFEEYGLELKPINEIKNMDAVVIAVPHNEFQKISLGDIKKLYWNHKPVLIDVKGMLDKKSAEDMNYLYWRL